MWRDRNHRQPKRSGGAGAAAAHGPADGGPAPGASAVAGPADGKPADGAFQAMDQIANWVRFADTQTIARYGFAEVGLHRIGLRVLAFNTRAIACYTKCGFVEEGRERESVLVGDDWHDDVIMGLLAREAS